MDNPIRYADPEGDICIPCLTALGGAVIGAGVEFSGQMIANGGNIRKVDWVDVVVEAGNGGIKASGVGTFFSGATETAGIAIKATFDLTAEEGNKNYFNGGKSGGEVVFDASADLAMGKVLDKVGGTVINKSNVATKQADKAYTKSSKELTKAQNSYNKVTNGGNKSPANGAGIAGVKLDVAKAKSQHAYTQKKVTNATNTIAKSKTGNVTKEVIDNKTTDYVKQKMGIGVD